LPRGELEKLLLDAALGNVAVMQEVIKANGLKKAGMPASGVVLDQESRMEESSRSPEPQEATQERNLEVERKKECMDMDGLKGVDGEGPLQFHHVTRRQFEVRKVRIMESLRRETD
jgi:hypothetical protein